MIQDVHLNTVSVNWIGTNEGSGGSSSGNSASLLVFVPHATVSAQIISSLSDLSYWGYNFALDAPQYQVAPWSVEWSTSAIILRYIQSGPKSTFPYSATIEHIPDCIGIQFAVYVGVFPDGTFPEGEADAAVSALATATIFIES